jgi:hypothetical protein
MTACVTVSASAGRNIWLQSAWTSLHMKASFSTTTVSSERNASPMKRPVQNAAGVDQL